MIAGSPADEGEDALRREADDAAAAVDDLLVALAAETYPVLDLAFVEGEFNQCREGRGSVRQGTAVRAAMGGSWLSPPARTGTTHCVRAHQRRRVRFFVRFCYRVRRTICA